MIGDNVNRKTFIKGLAAIAAVTCVASSALAQAFPNKTIKVITSDATEDPNAPMTP